LKGLFFHYDGEKNSALDFYTRSLTDISNSKNGLRQQALENIE